MWLLKLGAPDGFSTDPAKPWAISVREKTWADITHLGPHRQGWQARKQNEIGSWLYSFLSWTLTSASLHLSKAFLQDFHRQTAPIAVLIPKTNKSQKKYSEETRPRSTRKPSLTVALVSSFLFEYLTGNVKFWQILTSKIQEESCNIYSYNKNESGRGRIERQERQELSFYQAHQQKRCRRLWMWSLGRLRSWQSCWIVKAIESSGWILSVMLVLWFLFYLVVLDSLSNSLRWSTSPRFIYHFFYLSFQFIVWWKQLLQYVSSILLPNCSVFLRFLRPN